MGPVAFGRGSHRKQSNSLQEFDRRTWSPGTRVGEIMDGPLNPVLYERDGKGE
jgi:hypothetical protein